VRPTHSPGKSTFYLFLCLILLVLIVSGCFPLSTQKQQNGITSPPSPQNVTPPPHQLRRFIDTWNNIHLFQSFDYNIHDAAAIARYYDFVWGVSPGQVAAFRAGNSKTLISYYIPFHRDGGTFSNQDVGKQHNLAYWKNFHPDWVLYQCDRSTPAFEYGNPNIPLDFTNPAVISWQIQTYAQPASENGYGAIAADNLNMENLFAACGFYRNGRWMQRYTGEINDPQWRADIVTWVTRMQAALYALHHPLALIPNLSIGSVAFNDPTVQQVIDHVDGVLDEGGFTDYGHSYVTDLTWVHYVRFIEHVQQENKPYYIVNQFKPYTLGSSQIEWVLASYLMGKHHLASVSIVTSQEYGSDKRFSQYNAQIGSPNGEFYQSQGVYWRTYSNGLVVVNPSSINEYIVKTSASHYVDLDGNHVSQTFTLPPHSGLVLMPG